METRDSLKSEGNPHQHYTVWSIPNTEITLERISNSSGRNLFLFNASTVAKSGDFYKKVSSRPYQRDVPIENFNERLSYLSPLGWYISSRTIENFPDWLKRDINGNAIWKLITVTGLFLIVLIVTIILHKIMRRNVQAGSSTIHIRLMVTPLFLLLIPSLIVTVSQQLTMTGSLSAMIQILSEVFFYIVLAWLFWAAMSVLAESIIASRFIRDRSLNAQLVRLIFRALGVLLVVGIFLQLSNRLGAPLYSLVAGLGVDGIALALTVRPTLENFVGGLVLFSDKPVRIGDYCHFGVDYGFVEDIGMRSTRIRKRDDSVVTIPNAKFSQLQLTNLDRRRRRLYDPVLGLRYETSPEQLRYVLAQLREMLLGHPKVSPDQLYVRFISFGAYSLDIQIYAYIKTRSRFTYYAIVEEWRSEGQLPFPKFSEEVKKSKQDKLDYPQFGSPHYKPSSFENDK